MVRRGSRVRVPFRARTRPSSAILARSPYRARPGARRRSFLRAPAAPSDQRSRWLAETSESLSPSLARSASGVTTRPTSRGQHARLDRDAQVLPLVRPSHCPQGDPLAGQPWRRPVHSARPSSVGAGRSWSAKFDLLGRGVARPARHPGPGNGRRRRGRAGRSAAPTSTRSSTRPSSTPSLTPSLERLPFARRRRCAGAAGRQALLARAPRLRARAQATCATGAPPSAQGRAGRAPARRGARLSRLPLGRAQAGPVARPRDADPGFGDHTDLHRGDGRLPRRP